MKSYSLPDDERALIKSKFADAPVSNPNGTNGINLHLIRSDQVPYTRTLGGLRTDEYENKYFDHNGQAYHYAILVDRSSLSESVDGGGAEGIMHVSGTVDDTRMGTTFIHELGHSMGLMPDVYRGIDTTDVPFDEYPSVLNYNAPPDHYSYTSEAVSDAGFDDWKYIEKEMFTPSTRLMPGPDALDQCVGGSFAGGDGSTSNPYRIETLHQPSVSASTLMRIINSSRISTQRGGMGSTRHHDSLEHSTETATQFVDLLSTGRTVPVGSSRHSTAERLSDSIFGMSPSADRTMSGA
ncbi:hypothetical protein ACFQJ5_00085 [Halomicroarcula sp. GCM10025324]|uniref:hypothetical protein n=1 Tax=Haloarcula TaxID=2237 RepID=UPI0023E82E0C|nr:hypothetical protein [Halomicroarcula sp. ZS-22-S1]